MELWIWIDSPTNRNIHSLLVSAGILIDLSIISSSNFVTCSAEFLCKMHPNLYQHLKQHGLWASFVGVHIGLYPLLATSLCFMHACCMMMNNSLGICRYGWALKGFSSHIKYCQMCLCHYLLIRFPNQRSTEDSIRLVLEGSDHLGNSVMAGIAMAAWTACFSLTSPGTKREKTLKAKKRTNFWISVCLSTSVCSWIHITLGWPWISRNATREAANCCQGHHSICWSQQFQCRIQVLFICQHGTVYSQISTR